MNNKPKIVDNLIHDEGLTDSKEASKLASSNIVVSEYMSSNFLGTELHSVKENFLLGQDIFMQGIQSPFNEIVFENNALFQNLGTPPPGIDWEHAIIKSMSSPLENIGLDIKALSQKIDLGAPLYNKLGPLFDTTFQQVTLKQMDGLFANSSLYNQLKNINIAEIVSTYNDLVNQFEEQQLSSTYNEMDVINNGNNKKTNLTLEEINEIIDKKFEEADKNKPGFLKEVFKDILVNLGTDAVKWFFTALIIPLIIHINSYVIEHHQEILNYIKEYFSSHGNEIAILGFAKAKQHIKNKGLNKYEFINCIGIIRTETYIRAGKSKKSSIIYSKKIKKNTVVNIIEHKGNWLKVQLTIQEDEEYIEGWIEESKVNKFKKVK